MKHVIVGAHLRRQDVEPAAAALSAGDLFLSGVPIADDQPLGDRDLLLRVSQTRAALLERATFLAIRYGFSVWAEAEAAAKCAPHLARWKRILEENRDRVEMTLKIAASSPKPRPDRHEFASGSDYLRALHASAARVDDDFRAEVERLVAPVRGKWVPRDNASLEYAALIDRADVERVTHAGEELKRLFPRVPFLLSGPWPLEVFGEDDHE
ncbi:MAG TPA: GvpL/GvpF family gas vesicle protein [Thermoanaerobaculia bacterium]|nr:GvpL/GvpF family gas vesicle protein [Thermoanaerobaculia bacterium]